MPPKNGGLKAWSHGVRKANCSSVTTVNQGDYFACECKGTDGNPPADVTWYKNNTQIVTGKGKAILSFGNVDKDNNRTYRCEAKNVIKDAKNETEFELIVNCKLNYTLRSIQHLSYFTLYYFKLFPSALLILVKKKIRKML